MTVIINVKRIATAMSNEKRAKQTKLKMHLTFSIGTKTVTISRLK